MTDAEVIDHNSVGLAWGWEPVISTTENGVYFMNVLGQCQWEYPTEEAWDEEQIPIDIVDAQWLRTLSRIEIRESASIYSSVIGSMPAGEYVYVLDITQAGKR